MKIPSISIPLSKLMVLPDAMRFDCTQVNSPEFALAWTAEAKRANYPNAEIVLGADDDLGKPVEREEFAAHF